ncbi:MAG: phosphoribosylglycinamide formyltransferase [Hyphomicrobiaceae bacterium]|nr:phosphoribosylglycinamide formyltransferase [Hyphomicrobiaceae bacterium]
MRALVEAAKAPDYPAEIALILSNRPDAAGLDYARTEGIPAAVVDHKPFRKDREGFERTMQAALESHGVEIVALAGFMRLVTPWFVEQWHDRLINIHPALLPSFKGLDTHQRAIDAGVKLHGATVHLVRAEMDEGPILMQGAVPVLPDDSEETLAARVLAVEHRIYPQALALLCSDAVTVEGLRAKTPVADQPPLIA